MPVWGTDSNQFSNAYGKRGIRIIGSSNESIDMAEDRERFDTLMGQLGIARPKGCLVESVEEAMEKHRIWIIRLLYGPVMCLAAVRCRSFMIRLNCASI